MLHDPNKAITIPIGREPGLEVMAQLVYPSRQHPTGHEEGQADTAMEDTTKH